MHLEALVASIDGRTYSYRRDSRIGGGTSDWYVWHGDITHDIDIAGSSGGHGRATGDLYHINSATSKPGYTQFNHDEGREVILANNCKPSEGLHDGSQIHIFVGSTAPVAACNGQPTTGGETAAQKEIKITLLLEKVPVSNSENTKIGPIKVELWNSSHTTLIKTIEMNQDTKAGSPELKSKFQNVSPGTYLVCATEVSDPDTDVNGCKSSTKTSSTASLVTFKGEPDPSVVDAPGSQESQIAEKCSAGAMSFLLCPALEGMVSIIQGVQDNFIEPFLKVEALNTESDLYRVWSSMRNLTNILFVVVFFVIIFGSALSINVDSYTVKKALPKLFAAIILVQFSFFIAGAAVDVTNVLGDGIASLIVSQVEGFRSAEVTNLVDGVGSAAGLYGLGVLAGQAVSNIWLVIAMIVPVALTALVVAFTLVIRQVAISFLIITAPFAFLSWILPNTQKMFELWKDNFTKILLMYPLIMILFASGKLFSVVATATVNSNPVETEILSIISVVAQVLPLILLPATFKLAGSGMTAAAGALKTLQGKAAGGKDGNGGLMGAINDKKDSRRAAVGAGAASSMFGKPIGADSLRAKASRPGFNKFGQTAKTGALSAFNTQLANAAKELEASGATKETDVMSAIAHGGYEPALKSAQAKELKAQNELTALQAKPNKTASDLKAIAAKQLEVDSASQTVKSIENNKKLIKSFEGARMPMAQAVALGQLADIGLASAEHFEAAKNSLSGNPHLQSQVLSSAGVAMSKVDLSFDPYKKGYYDKGVAGPDGKVSYSDPNQDPAWKHNFAQTVGRLDQSKINALTKIQKNDQAAMVDIISGNVADVDGPAYRQMIENLVANPNSGLTSAKRKALQDVLSQTGGGSPTPSTSAGGGAVGGGGSTPASGAGGSAPTPNTGGSGSASSPMTTTWTTGAPITTTGTGSGPTTTPTSTPDDDEDSSTE